MTTETDSKKTGQRKHQQGMVVSAKMQKTVLVAVTRQVKHPQYGKYVRRVKKYMAHDERGECGIGDLVQIVETRPLSKRKCWRVQKIVTKAA